MKRALLGLVMLSGTAAADGTRIEVPIGETVELDVGYAIGSLCDDTSVVTPEMREREGKTNVFALTGVKLGTTLCRVGTDVTRSSYLFEIHVVPAKPKRR